MYTILFIVGFTVGTFGSEELKRIHRKKDCRLGDVERITVRDLESLVETFAKNEGITISTLLLRLYQTSRSKQNLKNEAFLNSLEDISIQELLDSDIELPVIPDNLPPQPSDIFSFPKNLPKGKIPKPIEPFLPPKIPHPPLIYPEPQHELPLMFPSPPKLPLPNVVPILTPLHSLRPPPGAVVKINAGDSRIEIPEVIVTVSPMMTVVEALRQADIKFQRELGFSPNDEVISFHHSPLVGCYVVSRFDTISMKKDLMWKITISDREGKTVYDGICIPSGRDVIIKPGMIISLTYTPF
ncbi:uncharacterized protein LOC111629190 [Centruroides sculpturatus]|uniref:uncharacterized protein LOC111629190 n=1 Tax=Centruroides sculpturatus TaxID=218467 RepID=UPI000C6E1C76|nr:uncharacterized protein LOC111629190 [Centruroides sculpturatus]